MVYIYIYIYIYTHTHTHTLPENTRIGNLTAILTLMKSSEDPYGSSDRPCVTDKVNRSLTPAGKLLGGICSSSAVIEGITDSRVGTKEHGRGPDRHVNVHLVVRGLPDVTGAKQSAGDTHDKIVIGSSVVTVLSPYPEYVYVCVSK
jgi:hypothetical protein